MVTRRFTVVLEPAEEGGFVVKLHCFLSSWADAKFKFYVWQLFIGV